MACKIKIEDVLTNLKSWRKTSDERDAVIKEFKFSNFQNAFAFITVIALKAEGYARERTVYVDHRDNNISSTVQIPEENRVIQIAEKKHEVVSKVLLAA